MSTNNLNIKYLESLLTGIKEVTGCRIVTNPQGEISEIHVTAESDRPPRLIARDVDTLLQVKAGLDVDYRKIGVVVSKPERVNVDSPAAEPRDEALDEVGWVEKAESDKAPEEPAEEDLEAELPASDFIVEEDAFEGPQRVLFHKISVTHAAGRVKAEVTLGRGERRATGESDSADTGDGHLAAVVHATLDAMLLLFEPGMEFAEPQFKIVPFGREEVMVVYLSSVEGRSIQTFTGSTVIRQDPRQAAVLATLSALNRVIGLWPERGTLDFEIL